MYRILLLLIVPFFAISADTLTIMSGIHKPPYVIQDKESGFEIELVRMIVKEMGKTAVFHYVNYGRASKMLYMNDVDGVMSTNDKVFSDRSVLTHPYIQYQNVAVSLAENNFKVDTISDLSTHSIASFQLAHKVLGTEFNEAAMSSPMFVQMSDQSKQPEMLFRKRIDFVVMERQIFYTLAEQSEWSRELDKVRIHSVFPVSDYSMAFKEVKNVALFNTALKVVLKSKQYEQLKRKYGFHSNLY
ncbi:transporter substrate-binding domain-containing protein [Paraglaciecola aquimarina]|uniref:Transporter substrate-binding domain-containing protein n=1 Tax=Paraglaciecola aquimarina TaxID=1235557 RepID=A0ABU3T118_9ALTE|nr:transporter substrate-binding domain-containing protein [Paraglaciecola aquimarina]MDU0355953.1 transporter substrate-binding domain-containing protein [Paraglaciecola aquimarina]